ncbi:MAG TPA: hypothetical protein PKO45_02575 [Rubrivivax sp.]|nr:hypothetical protein [Rubrivivax sp.]
MNALQHHGLSLLGALALAAAVGTVALARHNQSQRLQLAQQQQYLQQSVQLEGLYRDIVRALAELAARSGDAPLRTLLQQHGIQYTVNPPAAPATPAAAAPTKPAQR